MTATASAPEIVGHRKYPGLRRHVGRDGLVRWYLNTRIGGRPPRGVVLCERLGAPGISQADAWRLAQERIEYAWRAVRGLDAPSRRPLERTVGETVAAYIAAKRAAGRRPKTIRGLDFLLGAVLVRFLGDRPLALVETSEVEAMLATLRADGFRPRRSARHARRPWAARSCSGLIAEGAALYEWARRRPREYGANLGNPFDAVERPNLEPRATDRFAYLHPRDDGRLLGAIRVRWARNAVAVGLYFGTRINALVSLPLDAISWDDGTIFTPGILTKGRPCRGRADLAHPIGDAVRPYLLDQWNLARDVYARPENDHVPPERRHLFPSPENPGKHVHVNTLRDRFHEATESVGFGRPRFHLLGTVASTRFAVSEADGLYRAAIRGAGDVRDHADARTTTSCYIVPMVERLRPVVARLDEWIARKRREPAPNSIGAERGGKESRVEGPRFDLDLGNVET